MVLSKFERDILASMSTQFQMPELTEQVRVAGCARREYTGAGFFVDLAVPGDVPPVVGMNNPHAGPQIVSSSLEFGGGTLLYNADGQPVDKQ